MPTTLRRRSIIQRLLDEPCRFQFFQAVRLIERWLGERGVAPGRALGDYLRFENSLALSFPASQLEALRAVAGEPIDTEDGLVQALEQALAQDQPLRIAVTPAFMGFLGTHGTLPHHYTERIAAYQAQHKDEAPRAFLDLFSNRALGLLYDAWRTYRVELAAGAGNDGFRHLLLNVVGFQPRPGGPGSDPIDDEAIASYAGTLLQRPVSAAILGRVLHDYFKAPVAVAESVGSWSVLAPHEQCSLGGQNADVGTNTILGERSWRPDLGARLSIGPLDMEQFDGFLPSGAAAVALAAMLRLFADQTVTYEIKLTLAAGAVRPICIGGPCASGARLGYDSFLVTGDSDADRDDMTYSITPMAPLCPLTSPPGAPASCQPSSALRQS